MRLVRRGLTWRSSTLSTCLSAAKAMAVSQSLDHGRAEAAKKARASRLKILSPMGLSSRLPMGRQLEREAQSIVLRPGAVQILVEGKAIGRAGARSARCSRAGVVRARG